MPKRKSSVGSILRCHRKNETCLDRKIRNACEQVYQQRYSEHLTLEQTEKIALDRNRDAPREIVFYSFPKTVF